MSYFSLRKHDPDDEPEEEAEGADEGGEDAEGEVPVSKPAAEPQGVAGALWWGVSGPGRWLTARGRPVLAWLLYAGSAWAPGYYGGWVAVGVASAWLLLVLLFIPREFKDRMADWFEGWSEPRAPEPEQDADAVEESAPTDPHTVLVRWLDDLTRDRSGIHLKELHRALTQHPQLAHLKRAEMRAWLDRHQIAVDRTLRVGDVAGRSGVSRATVEALLKGLSPLPESRGTKPPVHTAELHDSPVESGLERGGEHAA